MPYYTYECSECHNQFEVEQRITDEPLIQCPVCLGRLEKIITASNFHLKGEGWYKDGYTKKDPCST